MLTPSIPDGLVPGLGGKDTSTSIEESQDSGSISQSRKVLGSAQNLEPFLLLNPIQRSAKIIFLGCVSPSWAWEASHAT